MDASSEGEQRGKLSMDCKRVDLEGNSILAISAFKIWKSKSDFQCRPQALLSKYIVVLSM